MRVAATARKPVPMVEGWLPTEALTSSARLGITDAILPVVADGCRRRLGDLGGGRRAQHPAAISALGTSGAGIDVGVISDSIDQVDGGVADSQATATCPPEPRVVVLLDDTGGLIDEGRAMAEIIYDEAPGLDRILFALGTAAGAAGKAASIDDLVADGADVIADDIFYLDRAVLPGRRRRPGGGPGAGRRRRLLRLRRQPRAPELREHLPRLALGSTTSTPGRESTRGLLHRPPCRRQPRQLHPGRAAMGRAGWERAPPTSTCGCVTTRPERTAGLQPPTTSPRDSAEVATYSNTGGSAVQPCVEIQRFAGSGDSRSSSGSSTTTTRHRCPRVRHAVQHDQPRCRLGPGLDGGRRGQPGRPGPQHARGVQLARAEDAPLRRRRHPARHAGGARQAASSPPPTRSTPPCPGFATFFGTSAAAPSAAGIAALLRSANPAATVNEIYAQMTGPPTRSTARSTAGQPDADCGAGFILADHAMAGLDRTGAVVIARRATRVSRTARAAGTRRT